MASVKRHPQRPYLRKSPYRDGHRLGTEKDSEYFCTVCRARVTVSPVDETEYGHVVGCIHRPDFPSTSGRRIEDEYLEHICDDCGRGDFVSQRALSIHKTKTHDDPRVHPLEECANCGDDFRQTYADKKYCSRECSIEANNKPRRNRETISCEECGTEMTLRKSLAKRRKHCSRECKADAARRDKKECEQCETTYQPNHPTQKYCSRECLSESQRDRVTLTCGHCLEDFEVPRCREDVRSHCSAECRQADSPEENLGHHATEVSP